MLLRFFFPIVHVKRKEETRQIPEVTPLTTYFCSRNTWSSSFTTPSRGTLRSIQTLPSSLPRTSFLSWSSRNWINWPHCSRFSFLTCQSRQTITTRISLKHRTINVVLYKIIIKCVHCILFKANFYLSQLVHNVPILLVLVLNF